MFSRMDMISRWGKPYDDARQRVSFATSNRGRPMAGTLHITGFRESRPNIDGYRRRGGVTALVAAAARVGEMPTGSKQTTRMILTAPPV